MLRRELLLVVKDAEKNLKYFESIFSIDAWKIYTSSSVKDAKKIISDNFMIEVVICGFHLSDGKSYEFLDHFRKLDDNSILFLYSEDKTSFSAMDISTYKASSYVISSIDLSDSEKSLKELSKKIFENYTNHMKALCSPNINSEYGQLRSVLVHTPSEEIERIDPDDLGWHLFESRPELDHMIEQHNEFIENIKKYGKRPAVLDVRLLMQDVLQNADISLRKSILSKVLLSNELLDLQQKFENFDLVLSPILFEKIEDLSKMTPEDINNYLFCGLNISDFSDKESDPAYMTDRKAQIVKPIPNIYFMRDPAFTLGKNIIISRMYWPIRRREPEIIRSIINHHPFMEFAKPNMVDKQLGPNGEQFTMEGGDVMVLDKGKFVITDSERTDRQGVSHIAKELLFNKDAELVYQPIIPPKRAFIHLDTVCSIAGPDHVVVHPKAVNAYSDTLCWTKESIKKSDEPVSLKKSFIDILTNDLNKEIIETAGGGPRASLEQFDDATNVFMVNSEVAVTYNRNRETNKIMNEKGIKTAEFPGSDLVMGRGGARCMTMPLRRD